MLHAVRSLAVASLAVAAPAAAQQPKTPPRPAPITPATFPPFQERVLPNGMRLVLVQSAKQPVISLSLTFPAGSAYDPRGKEGTAEMVAQLLTKGAGARTAEQIAEQIEGVGGSLNAGAGPDFLTIRADALAGDAPLAFSLLADAAARPTFPAKELDLLRTQALSALQLEMSQPASLASRYFAQSLYGAHPYGRRTTPASMRAISRADVVAFHRARVRPGGALLVVAGDISLDRAIALATRSFAGFTGTPAASAPFAAPPSRTRTEIVLVHRPGSVQSNVLVGNLVGGPADDARYAATIANKVLGGGTDARLFDILREKKGWTYGAYSNLTRPKGVGAFQASTEVRTEVTDSALVELMAQLRRIGSEPLPAAELDFAKGALVGSFPLTIETAEQVAGAVSSAKLLGLPADYLQTYRTRLSAVTGADAASAASKYIRPNEALVVVVGDGTKLYSRLAAIAPVRILSAQGDVMRPEDLTATAAVTTSLDYSRLVARSDSFTVLVQGNPLGFMRTTLEKTPQGFRYVERTVIGPVLDQTSELTFSSSGVMQAVKQTGKVQGMDTKIDVAYADGRVKGSATAPGAQGIRTIAVDTTVPAGVIDDNALSALTPAMRWAPGAKFTLNVFNSGQGTLVPQTYTVAGTESVTVPAGTFQAYRVEVTGGQAPVTMFVTTAAPHRLVKLRPAGAPIELVLAK
jgi:zinc protease